MHGARGDVFSFSQCGGSYAVGVPEIAEFVKHGAASISHAVAEKVVRQLPHWKLEFSQINAPKFPHLVDQLEFLATVVEDAVDGTYKDLPCYTLAQATFALIYAHKKIGIIPDSLLEFGKADDSAVVRAVLIHNEKAIQVYAASQNSNWLGVSNEA